MSNPLPSVMGQNMRFYERKARSSRYMQRCVFHMRRPGLIKNYRTTIKNFSDSGQLHMFSRRAIGGP